MVIALGTHLLPGGCLRNSKAKRLLSGDPFVELHCEHRSAPTVVHDFEQRTMSTSANGASDALGMGPSAGYSLISVITVFLYSYCINQYVIYACCSVHKKYTHAHICCHKLADVIFLD